MSKRALQIVLAILALIPILTGGLDLFLGARALNLSIGVNTGVFPPEVISNAFLDSQIRFLGAIWFGIGVMMYWIIPSIDQQTTLFRLLAGAIFLGGIGRLSSAFLVGLPPSEFIVFIALELIGMPLLVLWQSWISTSASEHAVSQETLS
jgi:hypothetical protein